MSLAAEVQLDIGGRKKPFNLYVDRNVLFVGTMNEDESTQTLSDKVIDRANVLRFGWPGTLSDQPPNHAAQGSGLFLSRQVWDSWSHPVEALHSHDKARLQNWLSDFNKAMKALERPFAHRVNLSILLYCANYPDQGPSRLQNAFADQLEQRILLKLRGIDTTEFSDGFGQLQTLIAKIGDDALTAAVQAGLQKPLFSFQGVDRGD